MTVTLAAFAVTEPGYGEHSIEVLYVDESGAKVGDWSVSVPLHAGADLDTVLAGAGFRVVGGWAEAPFGATAAVEQVD